ncbi:MAG: outer membrane protein beta-barrel domain [Acidobacteriota bacterium]|jgi:hypothetical protein|nr:outer membrane protein beta-barrel domain [Acidobacteriota bacterium]
MRRTVVAIAVAVLSTTAAFAGELRAGSTSISVYLSDVGFVHSSTTGSSWSGGGGFALDHAWTDRVSTVLSVGAERRSGSTFPVDLIARYHFTNSSIWTPYFGAGARYVKGPGGGEATTVIRDRSSAEVNGGVLLRVTPRVNLQFDVKHLLRSDSVTFDPNTKASIGVSWRF